MRIISYIILISVLLILIALSGCEKKEIYYDLTEDEKKALLYHTYDKDDTFDLLRNNTDTIKFKVKEKDLYYVGGGAYNWNREETNSQVYHLKGESMDSTQFYFSISAQKSSNNNLHLFFVFKINGYLSLMEETILDTISKHYYEKTINNVLYQDVYLFERDNYVDSGYTSASKGIIKFWNDSVSYSLIE
jgi:hypothetical protein